MGDEVGAGDGAPAEGASALQTIATERDTDVLVYSGPLDRARAGELLDIVEQGKRHKNVALVLCTNGGDADAAFILARYLRRTYEHFTLYVFGLCKSSGTLIALGANDIVMSARGEFGPLDVQITKEDEVISQSSGLDILSALTKLRDHAFDFFEHDFLALKGRSGGNITTRTAADIAATLSVGLLSPITAQVDPLKLGEFYRAIDIAYKYGQLLSGERKTIRKLVMDYPSHGFVIDFEEARDLFPKVREPDAIECQLEHELAHALGNGVPAPWLRQPHYVGIVGQAEEAREEVEDGSHQACSEEPGERNTAQPGRAADGQAAASGHGDNDCSIDVPPTPRRKRRARKAQRSDR